MNTSDQPRVHLKLALYTYKKLIRHAFIRDRNCNCHFLLGEGREGRQCRHKFP